MPQRRRHLVAGALGVVLTVGALAGPLHADPTEADRQFTFAIRLIQQQETKLAEGALAEFLKKFPDDPRTGDVEYYLAVLARRAGHLADAAARLAKVTHPKFVGPGAVSLLRGQVLLESGDTKGAIRALESIKPDELPDVESRSAAAYLLGAAYRKSGNLAGAAEQFDKASEAASSVRGQALLELGKVRMALKQYPGAMEALTSASGVSASAAVLAEARALAADLAYQQHQYERAADFYRQVIQNHESSPWFGPALVGLLRSLYATQQDAELVKQYKATRSLIPAAGGAEASYLYAAALIRLEHYPEAQATLTDFYRQYGPDDALSSQVAYLYAVCFYHTDVDGFERWFKSIEKDLPRMANRMELIYLRAQAAVKRHQPEEAIEHLGPLIDDPKSPYARAALLQRAALYEQVGNTQQAAADYAAYAQRYGEDASASSAGRRAVDLAFRAAEFQKAADLAAAWLKRPGIDPAAAATVQLKLAVAQIKLNHADDAKQTLTTLIDAKPDPTILALAQFYRGLLLGSAAKAPVDHKPDAAGAAAVASLTDALHGPLPEDQRCEALSVIAQLQRLGRQDDAALETYEQLRQHRDPKQVAPAVALWVGRAQHDRGHEELAKPWLDAVAQNPAAGDAARAQAMYYAAEAQRKLGKNSEAAAAYRRVITFDRGYATEAKLGLARSLAAADHVDDALAEYEKVVNAESSEVAASALLESAMLEVEKSRRFTAPADYAAAELLRTEARKRLSRVTILYDMPELGATPIRAALMLGELDEGTTNAPRSIQRLEGLAARSTVKPIWREALRAQVKLLENHVGDGVYLLRKIERGAGDPAAAAFARRKLKQLGEQP